VIAPGTLCYVVGEGVISRRIVTALGPTCACDTCGRSMHRIDEPYLAVSAYPHILLTELCENDLRPISDPDQKLEPDPVGVPKEVAA
jgi:hypothetical protein